MSDTKKIVQNTFRIPRYESQTVEFKSAWTKEPIIKTLVAFANTAGGDLYIGVEDDGQPIGVGNPDQIVQSIASVVSDRITPSIVDCLSTEILQAGGMAIVHVHINPGRMRPYTTDAKKAEGVYLRVGSTNTRASLDDLALIVRQSSPTPFELQFSPVQTLTFTEMDLFCQDLGITIDPKKHLQYGFWDAKAGRWTNIAYLCSDQSPAECICTEFIDDGQQNPINIVKYKGSLFALLRDTLAYVSKTNLYSFSAPTDGSLQRVERYWIQPDVLREALVNAIAHRDYSEPIATRLTLTPSALTITTYGGLPGLDQDLVFSGMMTRCRNEHLAMLLMRLKLMEGVGNGFFVIRKAYPTQELDSLLELGPKRFTIRLPRVKPSIASSSTSSGSIKENIVQFLQTQQSASRREFEQALQVSRSNLILHLRTLVNQGVIKKIGRGPAVRYCLKK